MKSPLSEAKSMGKQSSSPCWDSELFVLKDGGEAKSPTKNNHRSVVIRRKYSEAVTRGKIA